MTEGWASLNRQYDLTQGWGIINRNNYWIISISSYAVFRNCLCYYVSGHWFFLTTIIYYYSLRVKWTSQITKAKRRVSPRALQWLYKSYVFII